MKQKMSWSACWSCMMTTQPTWPMMRSPLSERIWRDEGLKLTQCWWDQNPSCVSELLNKDKYVNFIKTYNVENPLLLIVNFELSLFCHYKTQACYFSVKIITACTQYIYIYSTLFHYVYYPLTDSLTWSDQGHVAPTVSQTLLAERAVPL